MKKGFTYRIAPSLIRERPGMTSLEVAETAISRRLCGSDAKDPARSLASTLAKEVREGRHSEVRADRVGGVLRYYPTTASPGARMIVNAPLSEPDEAVSIRLSRKSVEIADLMVEAGKSKTRSEALAWLVQEGILRNELMVKRVRQAVEQIRAIKQALEH